MIGGSDRIDRLERRLARLEDLLRQIAMCFGIQGLEAELSRTDEPASSSTAVVEHNKRRR